MTRHTLLGSVLVAVVAGLTGWYVRTTSPLMVEAGGVPTNPVVSRLLLAIAFRAFVFGCYRFLLTQLSRGTSKRRLNDLRNVLRLVFGVVALVGMLGAVTDQ